MPRGNKEVCFSVNQKHRRPENGVKQLNSRKRGNQALFNCCSWLQPTSGCLEKQHTHYITGTNLIEENKETTGVRVGVASRRRHPPPTRESDQLSLNTNKISD